MPTLFTKNVNENVVVSSINDSLLLILNMKTLIGAEFRTAVQKFESLIDELAVTADFFDFVVGDLDKISEIFECLKSRQSAGSNCIQRERRPYSLFIAGAYLEDQICICALNALAVGYDVYLLNDFTMPRNITHRETFIARLTQAGVVLSTVQQMLYQWLAVETDQDRKTVLKKLLDYPYSL